MNHLHATLQTKITKINNKHLRISNKVKEQFLSIKKLMFY